MLQCSVASFGPGLSKQQTLTGAKLEFLSNALPGGLCSSTGETEQRTGSFMLALFTKVGEKSDVYVCIAGGRHRNSRAQALRSLLGHTLYVPLACSMATHGHGFYCSTDGKVIEKLALGSTLAHTGSVGSCPVFIVEGTFG